MPLTVKICGVRDAASARAAARADHAGFVFAPGRRRTVDVPTARALRPLLGAARAVGVFLEVPLPQVRAIADAVGLDAVQLHGPVSPADCAALAPLAVWRAVAVDEAFDPAQLAAFVPHVAAFVLDAATPGGGRPFDHARVAHLRLGRPWILAGGLTPETVADAIARTRPDGVDCASGIERDGHPDPARVAAFIENARRAEEATH
ncbi:MAG: phosphoribosylanthranilate isomerase [bacterium]